MSAEPIQIKQTPKNTGLKLDSGKLRYDLLPFRALQEVVKVLGHGATKYGDDNWRRLEQLEKRYLAASMRHLMSHAMSEDTDPESGLPHLAHCICSLMFILEHRIEKAEAPEG